MSNDLHELAGVTVALPALKRAVDALQLTYAPKPDEAFGAIEDRVELHQAFGDIVQGHGLRGAAREVQEEMQRRGFSPSMSNSIKLTWRSLRASMPAPYSAQRTLVAGISSAGGYLTETVNAPYFEPSLAAMPVLGRLGCTFITSSRNINIPKATSRITASWLPGEASGATESDPVLGQNALTPHTLSANTQVSRLLLIDSSPGAYQLVASELYRTATRLIENGALNGSGTNGAPVGILSQPGINSVSGASLALAGVMTAVVDAGDALDPTTNGGWVTTKAVASTLRQRAELAGSSITIWRGRVEQGTLADYPSFSTSNMPASTAVFGCWKFAVVADFGAGIEVGVNPYAGFPTGIVQLRVMATIDAGLIWPSAFTAVSSIT